MAMDSNLNDCSSPWRLPKGRDVHAGNSKQCNASQHSLSKGVQEPNPMCRPRTAIASTSNTIGNTGNCTPPSKHDIDINSTNAALSMPWICAVAKTPHHVVVGWLGIRLTNAYMYLCDQIIHVIKEINTMVNKHEHARS